MIFERVYHHQKEVIHVVRMRAERIQFLSHLRIACRRNFYNLENELIIFASKKVRLKQKLIYNF